MAKPEVKACGVSADRDGKYPLRKLRKQGYGQNSLCGSSAGRKMTKILFAEVPQTEKRSKTTLRKSRKQENGQNSFCGKSASKKTAIFLSADFPQTGI
jgi:hypothetical protein